MVKHTMLGVTNPATGDSYREGDVVNPDHFGDSANYDRLVAAGAIGPKEETQDLRSDTTATPSEAEKLGVTQSKIVDLDPAASPEADHQDLTAQAQGQPDQPKKSK
ncbi:MAG: hypothetical protein H0X33_13150 [Taibaiella sp.]|nr:hypothetical protein [Taibaiella sp.]